MRYTNGTNATLTYITTTNANGQAFYTISGSTTSQISQIYGIGADVPSSTYNEGFNYINTTVGSHITITNPSTYLTELIIVVGIVIIAFILLLGFLFVYNRRRSHKKLKKQAILRKN